MESQTEQAAAPAHITLKPPLWDDQDAFTVKVLRPSDFIHLMRNLNMNYVPRYIRNRYTSRDFFTWIPAFYFTGMRYPELWYLWRNPKWYDPKAGTIFLPKGYTKTSTARTVYLSDAGKKVMDHFWDTRPLPGKADDKGSLSVQERRKANVLIGDALDGFATAARFPVMEFGKKRIKHPIRDHEGNRVKDENGKNKYDIEERTLTTHGLTYRSFRTSWETLNVRLYPDRIQWIALSQGHDELTQLRHYLNQGLDAEDLELGRPLTIGYMR